MDVNFPIRCKIKQNGLRMDAELAQCYLTSREQMSSQQPGLVQSLAWQRTGVNDAQLVQQQATLRQTQELKRQYQIQQLEAMQRNRMNHMSSFSNQAGNHPPSFKNGILMHEESNYPWSSQVMAGSPNWLQSGVFPAMKGYSNGAMMPPEQGKSLPLKGVIPHKVPQSLYSMPVSHVRSGSGFFKNQVDKNPLSLVPTQGNFSNNQHSLFAEQMNLRDETSVPRQSFEGRGSSEYTTRQASSNAISVENQMQQSHVAPSLPDETLKQVASSQASVFLDPTEEKILFGSDDNIWDAFGESLSGCVGGLNNSDGAFPSIQSGSWSALMQSAVAESSSSDIGLQGECSGAEVPNSGSLTGNQQHSGFPDTGKQPACWLAGSATNLSSDYHNLGLQKSYINQSQEFLPNKSTQQSSEERKKWSDCSQPKAIAEESQSHRTAYLSGDFCSKDTNKQSIMENLSSSHNKMLRTTSDTEGSGRDAALRPKHTFSSQGFRLQLAPPSHSQWIPSPNFPMTSQDLSHTVNSPSSTYITSDNKGDKSQSWLTPAAPGQSLSSVHDIQQVEAQITRSDSPVQIRESLTQNTMGVFPASFSSESLYLQSVVNNWQKSNAEVKVNDQPCNASLDRQASHDKQEDTSVTEREITLLHCPDHFDAQVSMQQMAALNVSSPVQPALLSSMFQKGNLSSVVPNQWTNMPMPQQFLVNQSLKAAELLENQYQPNNIPGTSASIQQKQDFLESMRKGDSSGSKWFLGVEEQPIFGRQADATQETEVMFQGGETSAANPSDGSFLNSATRKRDIESFGRSLKPSANMVDSYALLYQMQTIKEMDPNMQQVKRFKGSDGGPDDNRLDGKSEHSERVDYADKSASTNTTVSSADAKMPRLIPAEHIRQQISDLLSCQGEPQTSSDSNVAPTAEHSQINLQMALTWFKQHGTLKKGQLTPVHDIQRAQLVANTEQHFLNSKFVKDLVADNTFGQVNTFVDTIQTANVLQEVHAPSELIPSHCPSAPSMTAPGVVSPRPNKHKSDTMDLLPWHKEVTLGYLRLPNMSLTEEYWAQAAHRLIEKIKGEMDVYDDALPVVQSRKRLVVTTQLMQQIFQPPPALCLSLNASKEYETVAYFAARLALADACSSTCQSESDSCMRGDEEKLSEQPKVNGRISDQCIIKVVEQFINRSTALDNELQRLKSVSVLDLRLECQDVERFSVINRFARFHGQKKVGGTETASSDAAARARMVRLQRHVNACPSPRNLPERVQCLPL